MSLVFILSFVLDLFLSATYMCLYIYKKGRNMALAHRHGSNGPLKANGGKCPEGVRFIEIGNPYGNGQPMVYDDTATGMDGDVKQTMNDVRRAFKPRRP